jgi:hypothetical protein
MNCHGAIPGPDPGACPDCGGWRKAGVIHDCAAARKRMDEQIDRLAVQGEVSSGMATGWLVYRPTFGTGWQWSAYGPRGGTQGSAASKEEAEMKAQRAMSDLAYPVDPSAGGA